MAQEWIVLVEGICPSPGFDVATVRGLLEALSDCSPGALHSADRVALQLHVVADDYVDALRAALQRCEVAVRELRCPRWQVARTEVMTLDEFEIDCGTAYRSGAGGPSVGAGRQAGDPRAGEELLRSAFEDPLTGMETSAVFAFRLERAAAPTTGATNTVAVVVLDLDGFTAVNERSGTDAGDELLAAMAERFRGVLGGGARPARVAGDRFAVLLERASEATAVLTAERLLATLRQPFYVAGGEVTVGASVGVAVGLQVDAEALMETATAALQAAKVSNRGGLLVFPPYGRLGQEAPNEAAPTRSSLHGTLLLLRRAAAAAAESATLADAVARLLPDMCAYAGWPMADLCVFDEVAGRVVPTAVRYASDADRGRSPREAAISPPGLLDGEGYRRVLAEHRPAWSPGVVVIPVVAGGATVAALRFFTEDDHEPAATVLDTLALVGTHLGHVVDRTGHDAAGPASALLQAVARRSSDLVVVLDANAVARFHHPTLGGDDDELRRVSLHRFVHPEDLAHARARIGDAMADEGAQRPFACRMPAADGTWRWMSVVATNLFDDPSVGGLLLSGRQTGRPGIETYPHAAEAVLAQPAARGPGRPERGLAPAPSSAPLRYELFGWEPERPAPSLDAFLGGRTATDGADGLRRALMATYERLACALAARTAGYEDDRPDHG